MAAQVSWIRRSCAKGILPLSASSARRGAFHQHLFETGPGKPTDKQPISDINNFSSKFKSITF